MDTARVKAALDLDRQTPDGQKYKDMGVKRLYYEATNPLCTPGFLAMLEKSGFETGVMRDPVWEKYSESPEQFVARVNSDVASLQGSDKKLSVMLDIERHDEAWVFRALTEFKRTNPGRNVAWTCEYNQYGWFSKRLIDLINSYPQCRILPQLYNGAMSYNVDSHYEARNALKVGIGDSRTCFMYGMRWRCPDGWDGCLYVENRQQLP